MLMNWIYARLHEPSTHRGLLGLILMVVGLSHDESRQVVDAVLLLIGVLSTHAAVTAEREVTASSSDDVKAF